MLGLLNDVASAITGWTNRVVVKLKTVRHGLVRAWIINQTSIWDDAAQRWRNRPDKDGWQRTVRRWFGRVTDPAADVVYTVAMPPLTGRARPCVIHVLPNVNMGGSTQLVVDLHNHLGDRYKMEVISSEPPKSARHRGMVIHHHALSSGPERLVELLRKRAPDLMHVHYWGSTDTPWYDGVFAAAGATSQTVLQNINTPVAPYDHNTVAMNVFVSNSIRGLDTIANRPARVIYPGIDLLHFAPRPFQKHAENSIGMVYRLEPDKLNLQSIDPLIAIAQRRPQTRVFIIGDGQLFMPFVERVKAARVFNNFVFAGAVPYVDLPAWYAHFKVFVAPVWQESFGQVTPFAMAMGLAVAGHRIGALPEILNGEETLGVDLEDTDQPCDCTPPGSSSPEASRRIQLRASQSTVRARDNGR